MRVCVFCARVFYACVMCLRALCVRDVLACLCMCICGCICRCVFACVYLGDRLSGILISSVWRVWGVGGACVYVDRALSH